MQLKNFLTAALGASAVSAQSLTELLSQNNDTLSLLSTLINTSPGVGPTLNSLSNITILAPSNNALQSFMNSTSGMEAARDPYGVAALLLYHILNGTYPGSAFTNETKFLHTALRNESFANVTGGQVVGGRVVDDEVTIYSGLLQSSKVVTADLNFTGGVVHVIDTVLTVPASDSATAGAANLTSLAGALTRADLVETVDSLEDVTIFAPSNSAFASIANLAGNITNEALADVLQYHVIQGSVVYSSDIMNGTSVETVGGGNVTITVDEEGNVFVNSARVVTPDVLVANGVVHVIDGVLNPENSTATPNPTTTEPAFPGASSASEVPFTSDAPEASTTITNSPTGTGEPGAGTETTSTENAAAMMTGAVGMGALFGAGLFAAIL